MTTMTNPARTNGMAALQFARRTLNKYIEDIPADKMTYQPIKDCNHVLWALGHLAYADDMFLTKLGDQPSNISEQWASQFGMGSVPVGDPSKYPALTEVKAKFDDNRQRLLDWLNGLSDAQLEQPLPEDWQSFAETYGVLMSTVAGHELIHAGQITMVRKALGLKPAFA